MDAKALFGKVCSSVSKAIEHALALGGANPADTPSAYASALRCRLEIQFALLLIQRGLSIELPENKARLKAGMDVESLKGSLSRASSLLQEGSVEAAGRALMESDAEAARAISYLRRRMKSERKAGMGPRGGRAAVDGTGKK